jgi:hypothetical protein
MDDKSKQEEPRKSIDEIEPCTIEDIIIDNIATKKVRLMVELKDGTSKEVRCTFRKLDMQESLVLGSIEMSNKGTQLYQRRLLHIASIEPKFVDPDKNEKWWKDNKITEGFVRNYATIINDFAGKNNFLLQEPNP